VRFVLFVEGHTERKAVPAFLKRWLDPRLNRPVGVHAVRFDGWAELIDDGAKKARMYLEGPVRGVVIAVIGLLDLYGPTIYPKGKSLASDRLEWAREHIEAKVKQEKFRQFFAVHETEAWLFSQPDVFGPGLRDTIAKSSDRPEEINFDKPPSRRLDTVYQQVTRRKYKKVTYGRNLFEKLAPDVACGKCPELRRLLDEMLRLAKEAGL